jgi:hypothetical protein
MALSLASMACLAVVAWSICDEAAVNRSEASASAWLEASLVPLRFSTWPPRRSISRRASALASARLAALRLPEARDELHTASPIAATTTRMSTNSTPFMASTVPIRCGHAAV